MFHAHAAAAEIGGFCTGAEPRQEDQAEQVVAAQVACIFGEHLSQLDGSFQQSRFVDAGSVVLDPDHHVIALLERVQGDRPSHGLSHRLSIRRELDAVIDGVANHVHERVAQLFDDEFVDSRSPRR